LASGSAPAQHLAGMLHYIFECDFGSREDFLHAARYIRKAAKQGVVAEAMYELGEMFRKGLLCDDLHMRFARRYFRRASKRGHAAATVRLRELRSCVFCGGDAAPRACWLCGLAKYCDNATCFERHLARGRGGWRRGGWWGWGSAQGRLPSRALEEEDGERRRRGQRI
jgi:hypothetical protein